MKSAYLTFYKDRQSGLIPAGCSRLVDSNNVTVLGQDYLTLDNIFDQPDQCKMIYRAGQKVPKNTIGSIPLTKIKWGNSFAWVIETPSQISNLYQDCCLGTNQAPTNSLASSSTTPVNGTSITLTATTTDDGTVSKVQFYEGDTLLGEDTVAPFTQVIFGITKGPHVYTSKAIDNLGKQKWSNAVIVNAS